MTAAPLELPEQWPSRPLTVAEYLALGETELRTEPHEGWLTVPPAHYYGTSRLHGGSPMP